MKLRFLQNTIILRLGEDDFENLETERYCEEHIQIYGDVFTYKLEIIETDQIDIQLQPNQIIFFFPIKEFKKWRGSSKIGYERMIGATRLIIEKDIKKKRE